MERRGNQGTDGSADASPSKARRRRAGWRWSAGGQGYYLHLAAPELVWGALPDDWPRLCLPRRAVRVSSCLSCRRSASPLPVQSPLKVRRVPASFRRTRAESAGKAWRGPRGGEGRRAGCPRSQGRAGGQPQAGLPASRARGRAGAWRCGGPPPPALADERISRGLPPGRLGMGCGVRRRSQVRAGRMRKGNREWTRIHANAGGGRGRMVDGRWGMVNERMGDGARSEAVPTPNGRESTQRGLGPQPKGRQLHRPGRKRSTF